MAGPQRIYAVLLTLTLLVLLADIIRLGEPSGLRRSVEAQTGKETGVIEVASRQMSLQTEFYRLHATPRQECGQLVFGNSGEVWTIGVQSDGDPRLNETREFIALGRYHGVHWDVVARVNESPGFVYWPAMTADENGGLWITWSELDKSSGNWDVFARHFDGKQLGDVERVSENAGADMRPAIVLNRAGNPVIAYESEVGGQFQIVVAQRKEGKWQRQQITDSSDSNFRPFLARHPNGTIYLAWDRFSGTDYDTYLAYTDGDGWSQAEAFFASPEDEQRPSIRFDDQGVVWIYAGKHLGGLKNGQRYEPPPAVQEELSREAVDEFQIGPAGRWWFFRDRGQQMEVLIFEGNRFLAPRVVGQELGYRAPLFSAEGHLWWVTPQTIVTILGGPVMPSSRGQVAVEGRPVGGSLWEQKNSLQAHTAEKVPEYSLELDGKTYKLYFGECHTHLRERPTDRIMEQWVDRFYLKARATGILQFASASDHDWIEMTNSKYMVQQAYALAFNDNGNFVALNGYEWSGDLFRRRRFGDRTILFFQPFSPVFRITDPESNTPQKLHRQLSKVGALDWPHHLGAHFAVMDWDTWEELTEPVVEMVSGHGAFEVYDPKLRVPVPYNREPIGKSSVQDGLARGYQFGLVGSSDSHNGLSGFERGMLALYASELTRQGLYQAFKARRTYALRGGEPIVLDVRLAGRPMGSIVQGSHITGGRVTLEVYVAAQSPLQKIEIVKNNRYVYTHDAASRREVRLTYQDTEPVNGKAYYYVRVWGEQGSYAWSSPIWVE